MRLAALLHELAREAARRGVEREPRLRERELERVAVAHERVLDAQAQRAFGRRVVDVAASLGLRKAPPVFETVVFVARLDHGAGLRAGCDHVGRVEAQRERELIARKAHGVGPRLARRRTGVRGPTWTTARALGLRERHRVGDLVGPLEARVRAAVGAPRVASPAVGEAVLLDGEPSGTLAFAAPRASQKGGCTTASTTSPWRAMSSSTTFAWRMPWRSTRHARLWVRARLTCSGARGSSRTMKKKRRAGL